MTEKHHSKSTSNRKRTTMRDVAVGVVVVVGAMFGTWQSLGSLAEFLSFAIDIAERLGI